MNRYEKYATFALIFALIATPLAYAAYYVYSPVVQEDVSGDFTLTLSSDSWGLGVTLSGTLLDGDSNPVNGATVVLYECANMDGDTPVEITTVQTNSQGEYTYWFITTEDTHYYRAGYEVT